MHARIALLVGTLVAAGIGTLASNPAVAGSFEIAPTTIDLAPGTDRAVFYLTNHGPKPIIVQIQGFDWRQTDGGEQLDDNDILATSPPVVRLVPERRQTVRLAMKPGVTAAERSFRLLVSELPDPQISASQGVRIMLQLSVPVFVASAYPVPAHLAWSAVRSPGGIALTARNTGTRHAKLMNMFLIASGGAKIALAPKTISYILAGASRHWMVALPGFKAGETLHVIANNDSDGAKIDAPIAVVP